MKIPPYYLNTTPWWIVCGHMKPMDRNLILYRIGKTLGMIA